MRVLVIPEDPTFDQHILRPVVKKIFDDLGRRARIDVLSDPHLGGVRQALDPKTVGEVLDRHPMVDLFLLILDRDCDQNRQHAVDDRVRDAGNRGKTMLGCLAIEEVEVWALALHKDNLPDSWQEVRKECHPKEVYFEPLAKSKGWLESLGKGRATAMKALAGNWSSLKGRCPELNELQEAIRAWLADR